MDTYQKRPKRKHVGATAEEYRFARYVEDWRHKVERVGNLNYPGGRAAAEAVRQSDPHGVDPRRRQRREGGGRPHVGPEGARCRGGADRRDGGAVRAVSARHPARHRHPRHHAHVVVQARRRAVSSEWHASTDRHDRPLRRHRQSDCPFQVARHPRRIRAAHRRADLPTSACSLRSTASSRRSRSSRPRAARASTSRCRSRSRRSRSRPNAPSGRASPRRCNTLNAWADHWHADNTDGAGMVHDLDESRH